MMPFIDSLLSAVTEPFADGFRLLVSSFEPYYHSVFTKEPGLAAGILFLLVAYSVVAVIKKKSRAKTFVAVKEPVVITRESYPGRF